MALVGGARPERVPFRHDRHAGAPPTSEALVETLRAARATERTVFEAFDAADRDTPPADGEWSPKDIQAHLGAWRRRMTERLAAIREGRPEPEGGGETDATNAVIHAERADWPWDRVAAGRRGERGRPDRRGRGRRRRHARRRPDGRLDHGQRGRTHDHPRRLGGRPGRARSPPSRTCPGRSRRSSIGVAGRRGRRRSPATTWPASMRSPVASTRPARSSASRCRPSRTCAISRRRTRTWSPSGTSSRSSRAADRARATSLRRACDAR